MVFFPFIIEFKVFNFNFWKKETPANETSIQGQKFNGGRRAKSSKDH